MQDVVWFSEVDKEDVGFVGGKGANLGELTKLRINVPNGFIVTSDAYYKNLKSSGALDRIRGILYQLDVEVPVLLDIKAKACQKEIENIKIDPSLANKIKKYYKEISGNHNAYVAVRSSATAEDLPEASFAGQQSTFLNVRGIKQLQLAIISAWASLFEARAIFYRVQQNFDHFKVGIAVPVQKMVQSQTSGIMFTVDPVTNKKDVIVIEAIYGLGELIVSGQVTPDHYEVDKKTFRIITKNIIKQEKQLVRTNGKNKLIYISKPYQKLQKLADDQIINLAKLGQKIEKHYFFPQDIEWASEGKQLFILQTRPVTTFKNNKKIENVINSPITTKEIPILQGAPASPVIGCGKVVIIKNPKELYKIQKGDVLVAPMTNPDYVPAMKKAVAIVTDQGGRTSHAAIVSRELGVACVVGTQNATKILHDGMVVTVDGAKGLIYKGQTVKSKKTIDYTSIKKDHVSFKTATKLYVNLAEPDLAGRVASLNVDGVGLLRAEFILASIGTHPKVFLQENRSEEFINKLSSNLTIFAKAFEPRPIIYRASDLKTNEYRNLKGGDQFEPKESNPMLGYRGAFRYIKDPDVFKLELEAIKQVRKRYKNLHLMIPFVRTVAELKNVKALIEESDLIQNESFHLWMMVEVPSNVILLEDFIKVGIDGVSIGSNDLTMLVLGTDRDNEEVAREFNEQDKAVLWFLEKTVKTAVSHGIYCSICGQAPSVYPELTQKLVSWGISSISVNPDVVDETRKIIFEAEQQLLKTKK